ncbi:MAG: ABC transporter [Flavobacteriales bacterium]|nr:MAG: ABC transporter [Flavobacteriales bacterium]
MELIIQNAHIGYPNTPLVKEINLKMTKGEVVLLMGNNGMGKTTFIKSILNQIPLLSGDILINHQSIKNIAPQEIAKKIAVVFSTKNKPYHYTTRDLIALGRWTHYPFYFDLNAKDKTLIDKVIEDLGLKKYENTRLENLSDGNLQKAFIARALVQESPMIILDEPTAHLDESNKIMLYQLLRSLAKENNKMILFSSHDWRLAKEFSDKIAYIKNQKMQFGQVESIMNNNNELCQPIQF